MPQQNEEINQVTNEIHVPSTENELIQISTHTPQNYEHSIMDEDSTSSEDEYLPINTLSSSESEQPNDDDDGIYKFICCIRVETKMVSQININICQIISYYQIIYMYIINK